MMTSGVDQEDREMVGHRSSFSDTVTGRRAHGFTGMWGGGRGQVDTGVEMNVSVQDSLPTKLITAQLL